MNFNRLNRMIDRLEEIDEIKQPGLFKHTVDDILKRYNGQISLGEEYET